MARTARATTTKKASHEEIERLAYQIFEESGRTPGRDLDNWLQAEARLATRGPAEPAASASASAPRPQPSRFGLLRK